MRVFPSASWALSVLAACLFCGRVTLAADVVINEIHYNPIEGSTLEFV